ncbi:MAG: SBBP repeat-containing protein, partial [Flavobacteriales bacterium]|nr:SBBP repeat-containing protein [Flavobacteriales bacterium]
IANALVVAPDNTVYVTGESANMAPQGTITTIRYGTTGAQLWADHPYGPSQDAIDRGADIALDPFGHVYVTGTIANNGGDFALIKYGANGRIWKKNYEQYPGADVPDECLGIAIDGPGNVYIAGLITSTSGMGLEPYVIMTDSAGNTQWGDNLSLSSIDERLTGVAVSPGGNVYVAGDWWNTATQTGVDVSVARYSPSGSRLWKEGQAMPLSEDHATRIATTADDHALVCGTAKGATDMDLVALERDADGALVWEVVYDGTASGNDEAVDIEQLVTGPVAVTGHTREEVGGELRHAIATMLVENGQVLWTRQFTGENGLGAWPSRMTTDAQGNIYIAGYASASGGTTTDGTIVKYDIAGDLQWSISYDAGTDQNDRFNDISLNAAGDVIVCGAAFTSTTASRYVTAQFGNAVGMNDPVSGSATVTAFPNPASTRLNFNVPTYHCPSEVFNALGERVLVTSTDRSIDVSAWNEGLYFLRTDFGDRTTTSRFTVQH